MSLVFKPLYEDVTNERYFGICDDKPLLRAYINTNVADRLTWIARVDNYYNWDITFTAIDNCIEFRKAGRKMESRCEGALTYHNTIILIEAKERVGKTKDWAKGAEDQLKNTIRILEERGIDLSLFENKRAAICNRLARGSKEKHTVRIRKFLDDTGYTLTINSDIKIS